MVGQLILGLSILVILHELGHFLAARAFGIKVEKFYLFLNLDEASLAEGVEAMKDFRVREGAAAQGTVGAQGKDRAQGRHP